MLKRINWKRVLISFIWLLSLSGLGVLMSFIEVKKGDARCKEVRIIIPGTYNFIERTEVDNILYKTQGPLKGRVLNRINIQELETALRANPFIRTARVFTDMDGVITVLVNQREPILRVLNLTNQDFYIDRDGYKIPTSSNFTARVLAANGFVLEGFTNKVDTLKTQMARDLFKTASFIEQDSLWRDQIEQLYVNQQNEIEMVPRVGNHKIILGNADSLQTKFRNLLVFYKKALPKVGWDAYKTINIKYYNQVVCEKADSTELEKEKLADTSVTGSPDSINDIQDTSKIITH
ncbi:cell division protein FtsQ/DivIB [Rubrolithibacter danxiaensis]|uniref:cell division protein FtsQ/DivIB n=1 Tax=Rubrolithibacter danxiaensis TaxID=3390805 RepID=UPI003BF7A7D5